MPGLPVQLLVEQDQPIAYVEDVRSATVVVAIQSDDVAEQTPTQRPAALGLRSGAAALFAACGQSSAPPAPAPAPTSPPAPTTAPKPAATPASAASAANPTSATATATRSAATSQPASMNKNSGAM